MKLAACIESTKPRLTLLAVLTAAIGYALAVVEAFDVPRFVLMLCGTACVVGGARALNQYLERNADASMQRTRQRPIPSGRTTPDELLMFGVATASIGLWVLAWGVNPLTSFLETLALALYLFVYTPLKQRSALCTLVGAIPGAIPPLAGWAAMRGTLDAPAWLLAAILFLWQLPHFLALAWLYQDDYARAGFHFLTVDDPSGRRVGRQIVLYLLALLPITLFPTLFGVTGLVYFCCALALGALFILIGVRAALMPTTVQARQLFLASIVYLPALLTCMLLDRVVT